MNKTIWKYQLAMTDYQKLLLPTGAEILSVQEQQGIITLWALVSPENKLEDREIEIFGTGHDVYYDMGIERKFIGTVQETAMTLVWHIFERIN